MSPFLVALTSHPIIVVFLLANLCIGFWAYLRNAVNSFEDYVLASRDLPTTVLMMTLLGTLWDNGYFSLHYQSYFFGLFNFSKIITFLLVGTLIAPRVIHFNNAITIGGLMREMYGKRAQVFSGIVSCFFLFFDHRYPGTDDGSIGGVFF